MLKKRLELKQIGSNNSDSNFDHLNDFNDHSDLDTPTSTFITKHKILEKIEGLQNHKQLETVLEESMERGSTYPSIVPRDGIQGRSVTVNLRNQRESQNEFFGERVAKEQ